MILTDTTPTQQPRDSGSSAALGGSLLLAAWIIATALVLFPSVWLAEQFALVGGQSFGRGGWVAVTAGYAAAVALPSLLGLALTKTPRYRAVFRAWALAGGFALLLLPVQFVPATDAQTAALAQIGGTLVYLIALAIPERRAGNRAGLSARPLWPALLAVAPVVWPWVIWGALGSWVDTVLNLAAALLLGGAAALTLRRVLFRHPPEGELAPAPFAAFAASVTLLIMGVAFGHNGQQLVLLFLLPALGPLLVAVARWGGAEQPAAGQTRASLLVGLVAAAPLLFLDPEELALILNIGSRDVSYYAIRATLLAAGIALLLGLLAWPLSRRAGRRALIPAALTTMAWLGLAAAYWIVGQPGLHGERLYVVLSHQADLSAATTIADPAARRAYVHDVLVRHADATQADLHRALEAGRIDYTPYYLANALEVDGGPLIRRWLESRPEVDRVLISPTLRPLPAMPSESQGSAGAPDRPQWNLDAVGAPRVWEEFGARGAGIVIGQSDSGVDGEHPELREQYRGNRPDGPAGDDYNWLDPWNATTRPTDWGGHGTHTLGTVLGRSVGVAPEATWIACVNLARNLGNAPRYLDCLQFLFAPFPQTGDALHDGQPELGAHVLNNSWGCPEIEGCDPAALLPAVRALRAAGVFVVASAGNDGSACATINAPISLYDEVFTVGASDEAGNIAPFSSRGPVTADGSGRTKPDVVAPGMAVLSAFPGGTYEFSDGTSMAGPHVVGVVALLWSAAPGLIGDVERTERIITETAQPLLIPPSDCGDPSQWPNNTAGYGLVDAYAAVAQALGGADE